MQTTLRGEGDVANVVFKVKRVAECGRCVGIAYAGRFAPTDLNQFQRFDLPADDDKSWAIRVFETSIDGVAYGDTDGIPEDQVVVALGYMNLDVAEPVQQIGFDNVSIRIIDLNTMAK